jgi:hypothetical protein
MLKIKLSRLKGKVHVQPSQDNRGHMVKKLEKESTITCTKLPQINLKTSYQKLNKLKINKKAHVKCLECSILGHFSSECLNKKSDQAKPSKRQRNISQRRCFGCKEKMSQYSYLSKRRSFEVSLSKPDCLVWQTGVSGFNRKF